MLLCSLARGPSHRYWVTLQPWVTRDTRPALAYLACLLDYFDNDGGSRVLHCTTALSTITLYAELSSGDEGPPIIFQRIVRDPGTSPPEDSSQQQLVCCEVECPSNIGRQDTAEVEVDFANKDVGFGPGGTQEEILFGMTPEVRLRLSVRLNEVRCLHQACPAVLVCPTLGDTECLLVSGVARSGDWAGYGFNVTYAGPGDGQHRCYGG